MIRHKSFKKWIGVLFLFSFFILGSYSSNMFPNSENISEISSSTPLQTATTADYATELNITYYNREILITQYNTVEILDEYHFYNNGTASISTVPVYLRNEFIDNLEYYNAYDSIDYRQQSDAQSEHTYWKITGSTMLMQPTGNQRFDYTEFEVGFNEPLIVGESKNFTIKYIFSRLYTITAAGQFHFDAPYSVITAYEVTDFDARITFPYETYDIFFENPDGYSIGPNNTDTTFITRSIANGERMLAPFTEIRCEFEWTNNANGPVYMTNVDRTIDINPWGYIRVTEEHTVFCANNYPINSLIFKISEYAEDVVAFDYLGAISGLKQGQVQNYDGTYDYTMNFQENRAELQYQRSMTYTIQYYLDWDVFHSKELGTHNVNFNLYLTKIPYYIEELSTTVNLIGVRKITRLNFADENQIDTPEGISLEFFESGVTFEHSYNLDISYKTNFLQLYARPLIIATLFMTIIGLYIVISNSKHKEDYEEEYLKESVPISELSRFVELYEEKNALQVEANDLDQQLRTKRLRKKDYNREIKTLNSKLKELESEIEPFKTDLAQANKTLLNILQKLDYLEAEKISVQDSIKMLIDRYKKGKLPSKAAYERLADEMKKRIDSAQNKIDRYINELRAYLV